MEQSSQSIHSPANPSRFRLSPSVLRRASAFANVQNGIEWFDEFDFQTIWCPAFPSRFSIVSVRDSLAIKIENVSVSVSKYFELT